MVERNHGVSEELPFARFVRFFGNIPDVHERYVELMKAGLPWQIAARIDCTMHRPGHVADNALGVLSDAIGVTPELTEALLDKLEERAQAAPQEREQISGVVFPSVKRRWEETPIEKLRDSLIPHFFHPPQQRKTMMEIFGVGSQAMKESISFTGSPFSAAVNVAHRATQHGFAEQLQARLDTIADEAQIKRKALPPAPER